MKFNLNLEDVTSASLVNRILEFVGKEKVETPSAVKDREELFKLGKFEMSIEMDMQETIALVKEGTEQLKELMPLLTFAAERRADRDLKRDGQLQHITKLELENNQLRDQNQSLLSEQLHLKNDFNDLGIQFADYRKDCEEQIKEIRHDRDEAIKRLHDHVLEKNQ